MDNTRASDLRKVILHFEKFFQKSFLIYIKNRVSKKTKKNKYVVKWQTLPYDQCTWVKEEDLKNESFLIDRYHDRINRVEEKHLKIDKTKEDFSKYEFKTSPQFLKREMYDYQIQGLNWMLYNWWNDRSVILADEMGLGKSIQTIALIATFQQLHQFEHTLLVVPLSTLLNWFDSFFRSKNIPSHEYSSFHFTKPTFHFARKFNFSLSKILTN